VKYLLDTHVWIWMVEADPAIPRSVAAVLKDVANAPLALSAISPWEVAKKLSANRLTLSRPGREWVVESARNPGMRLLPLGADVAWEANHLPGDFHRDPADQIIVATARQYDLTLITADRRILAYRHVRTLWR